MMLKWGKIKGQNNTIYKIASKKYSRLVTTS